MSIKSLHRITIETEGKLHPILSVRENAKGSLIIKPRRAEFSIQDGVQVPMTEQKYTVHMSNNAKTNTIHHALRLNGQPDVDTHLVTCAIQSGRVELLYIYTAPNLNTREPSQPVREKDKLHRLANYLPDSSTLHIAVFLAPPEASQELIETSPVYSKSVLPFRHFSIILLSSYSVLPSQEEGWLKHYATAPVSFGGERRGENFYPAEGMQPHKARLYAESQLMIAHVETFQRALAILGETAVNESDLGDVLLLTLRLGLQPRPYRPSNDASDEV